MVAANIIAGVIVEMAPHLVEALRPGGTGIAGGILGELDAECARALGSAGAAIERTMRLGEWTTLIFSRE